LAPRRFASKTQIRTVGLSWISLDSLVRIEPFQWVALDFRKKKILAPFSAPGALDGGQGSGVVRKRSVTQAASLTSFPIICNKLLALIALTAGRWPIQVIQIQK
jgi:hypothetical protein